MIGTIREPVRMKNLSNRAFKRLLCDNNACDEAIDWIGWRDMRTAWQECPRGDWMLWIVGKMSDQDGWPTRNQVVAAACDCAETALKFVPKGEDYPRRCIETVRRYLHGEVMLEEVRAARQDVATASAAYHAASAAAAAYAAIYAAAAAAGNAGNAGAIYAAAAAATYAAAAAAAAAAGNAGNAAAAAARMTAFRKMADLVRAVIPIEFTD